MTPQQKAQAKYKQTHARVQLYFTHDELAILDAIAKAHHLSRAAYIRHLFLNHATPQLSTLQKVKMEV